jgi:hypothetical protein
MIWEALTKLALLGTERGQLPTEVQAALEKVGIDPNAPSEQQLLDAAALYHQLRRAGYPLQQVDKPLQQPPSESKRKPLPDRAARQLQHIIQGRYREALPEFLTLLEKGNWQLPPEQLPLLFDYALKRPVFWRKLRPLLDPIGYWLLRENPAWHALAERPAEEDWTAFETNEQLMMLRYLRYRQAEMAMPKLETIWEHKDFNDKKRLLEALEEGLSEADIPFLEKARTDSRKEVRQTAVRLQTLLPESPVQEALFAEAISLLSIDSKGHLQLNYPEELTKALKKLGIGQQNKAKYPGGKAATWAYELLSKIPPKRWETHFKRSTLDSMRLFLRGNRQRLLTDALANAALIHQDHRWIEAMVRHWWRTGNEERWNSALGKTLMAALPDAVFNDILEAQVRERSDFVEENSLPAQMLCLGAHNWSPALSKRVIFGFQERLKGSHSFHWNLWHYKHILKVAAYRAAPALLADFRLGWDKRAPIWERWAPDIDRLLKVLSFREDLYKSLRP